MEVLENGFYAAGMRGNGPLKLRKTTAWDGVSGNPGVNNIKALSMSSLFHFAYL